MWWLWLGCDRGERGREEAADAWAERMDELDAHAVAARDAVVQGDLGRARDEGRRLRAALPPDGVPATLDAGLAALDAATTPREAAAALTSVGQGCLQCHAERHASLVLREPQPVRPAAGVLAAEMERHRALVDGVWLGMIGGDDAALRDASAFLDQGGLVAGTPIRRDPGFALTAAAAAIDTRVHDLAHQLREAPSDRRGPLYTELLGTCADCHALARTRSGLTAAAPVPRNPEMNDHFVELLTLELAVVGGDVEAARRAAAALEVAPIDAPPEAQVHVRALRETAERVKRMDTLPALAQGTAELLAGCGRCHAATTGGPLAAVEPPPAADAPEMARHLYASFWMGQSLLAGDDDAWVAGATVLEQAGLGSLVTDTAADAAVHAIGGRALRATQTADRQAVLGELLATCSPCHRALPGR